MTWVLPPLTYKTTGLSAPVMARPISMSMTKACCYEADYVVGADVRPMQWFTATSGFPQSSQNVRAATATLINGEPMPGPSHNPSLQYQPGTATNRMNLWCSI